MGGVEKEVKRGVKKVRKTVERPAKQFGEELERGVKKRAKQVGAGGGGFMGKAWETVTLGEMESRKTRQAKEKAATAEAEQRDIIAEQTRQLEEEEEKRKKRTARGRAGRRSLLYAKGTEAGISQTLGG